jgi:hypothetical protein
MLLRIALIAVLCGGCAHPPAEKPSALATPPPAVTPAATPPAAPPGATFTPPAPAPAVTNVDFARDIKPILEARCQPCHFPGGRMYERLPFDRPETIRQLGPKLFTRLKDESSQATIRAFLSQSP